MRYVSSTLITRSMRTQKTFKDLISVTEEERKNSCFVDLLVKTYKSEIEKRLNLIDSRYLKGNEQKQIKAENLCNICGIKY